MATEESTDFRGRSRGRTPPGAPTPKQMWKASQARGEHVYDPGIPCVRGHHSLRWSNSGICIACKHVSGNAYNAAHAEQHRARARESAARRPDEIKAYRKAYYLAHREEAIQVAAEWEKANPTRVRARRARWYRDHRERALATRTAWARRNRKQVSEAHAAYRAANPEKVKAAKSLRRARELGAATGDRKAYTAFVKWSRSAPSVPCYWCKRKTKPGHRHLDHIIPLSKGGADAVGNLGVACPNCNARKSAKLPFFFAGQAELRLA